VEGRLNAFDITAPRRAAAAHPVPQDADLPAATHRAALDAVHHPCASP